MTIDGILCRNNKCSCLIFCKLSTSIFITGIRVGFVAMSCMYSTAWAPLLSYHTETLTKQQRLDGRGKKNPDWRVHLPHNCAMLSLLNTQKLAQWALMYYACTPEEFTRCPTTTRRGNVQCNCTVEEPFVCQQAAASTLIWRCGARESWAEEPSWTPSLPFWVIWGPWSNF